MDFDITPLLKLAGKPSETVSINKSEESIEESETALKTALNGSEGVRQLQRIADDNKLYSDRYAEMCKEIQRNIILSSSLQTEILKGVKAGEDIYRLFLKACKAISGMTGSDVFYNQIVGDASAVYGKGMLSAIPIKEELQATQTRVERLRTAAENEKDLAVKSRIEKAIAEHELKIAELEHSIEQMNK